jgi:cation transport protein ChaC
MSTLTRDALHSGEYLLNLGLPTETVWSQERLEKSLTETLFKRPPGEIWVFAYGSLMWNPLLEFDDCQPATLTGWHRSFCLRAVAGRGSPTHPGRMLALEPSGRTQGLALRLHEKVAAEELRVLWTREMAVGSYIPAWTRLQLRSGKHVHAIAFVADRSSSIYEADASAETVAPIIASASGSFGTNADYVHRLDFALAENALEDEYVCHVVSKLKEACAMGGASAPVSPATMPSLGAQQP